MHVKTTRFLNWIRFLIFSCWLVDRLVGFGIGMMFVVFD